MVGGSKIQDEIAAGKARADDQDYTLTMTFVLPGEHVPAQHVNLKLGPGLQQESNVDQQSTIISTRAGELKHSANNKQWWVESNAWRVRLCNCQYHGMSHPNLHI